MHLPSESTPSRKPDGTNSRFSGTEGRSTGRSTMQNVGVARHLDALGTRKRSERLRLATVELPGNFLGSGYLSGGFFCV